VALKASRRAFMHNLLDWTFFIISLNGQVSPFLPNCSIDSLAKSDNAQPTDANGWENSSARRAYGYYVAAGRAYRRPALLNSSVRGKRDDRHFDGNSLVAVPPSCIFATPFTSRGHTKAPLVHNINNMVVILPI
jgi:hypothetical protein